MSFWRSVLGLDADLTAPRPLKPPRAAATVPLHRGARELCAVTISLLASKRAAIDPLVAGALLPPDWWNRRSVLPRTADDSDIVECWEKLDGWGLGCETLAWSAGLDDPGLQQTALAHVIAFQLKNVVVHSPMELPLRWGPAFAQAAVAAYNSLWEVEAAVLGAEGERVERLLAAWPEQAGPVPMFPGDLVLLRALRAGFEAQRPALREIARHASEAKRLADVALADVKAEVRWWIVFGRRAALNRRISVAEQEASDAGTRNRWAQTALGRFDACLERLRRADPLGSILDGGQTSSGLALGLIESNAEGFQRWFIQRVVPGMLEAGVPRSGHPGARALMDAFVPLLAPNERKRWRAAVFLLRFFRVWIESCSRSLPATGNEVERDYFRGFFRPWTALRGMMSSAEDDGSVDAERFQGERRAFIRDGLEPRVTQLADAMRGTIGRLRELETVLEQHR